MKVVVLGAYGFLGSSVTRYLANLGHEVLAFGRRLRPNDFTSPNIVPFVGDIRDKNALRIALSDADILYHFASITHPSMFFDDPEAEYKESICPLFDIVEIASRCGVKKIVFPSSGGTIYAASNLPCIETSPVNPRSPYAMLKLEAERILSEAAYENRFALDIYRIGNPYGAGQPVRAGQGVIPHWINCIRQHEPVRIFGDGTSRRDYVFIEDTCQLMATSCDRIRESDIFNVGTGEATSLEQLLQVFKSLVQEPFCVEYVDSRISDIHSVHLSSNKVLSRVPDFHFTPLHLGIEKTLSQLGLLGQVAQTSTI